MKKISKVLILVMILGLFVTGCAPKVSLQERAQLYFELYANLDLTRFDEFGEFEVEGKLYTKEQAEKDITDSAIEWLTEIDKALEVTSTDAQKQQFIEDFKAANKRVTANIEIVSEEKDKAVVKYTVNPIDINPIYEKANDYLYNKAMEDSSIADDDVKYHEMYLKEFGRLLREDPLSSDTKTAEVSFVVSNMEWTLATLEEFDKITELTFK